MNKRHENETYDAFQKRRKKVNKNRRIREKNKARSIK